MSRRWHWVAVALGLSGPALGGQDEWFVTSGGVRVATPVVAGLDCAALLQVLIAIDGSGYRGVASAPDDRADDQLFLYENRVARRYYADCVNAPTAVLGSFGAFSHGFVADDGGVAVSEAQ